MGTSGRRRNTDRRHYRLRAGCARRHRVRRIARGGSRGGRGRILRHGREHQGGERYLCAGAWPDRRNQRADRRGSWPDQPRCAGGGLVLAHGTGRWFRFRVADGRGSLSGSAGDVVMDALAEFSQLACAGGFADRHIGPGPGDIADMLRVVGAASLDELASRTVPGAIRLGEALNLPPPIDEAGLLAELRGIASRNEVRKSLIGCGYHGTHTPPVIQRNILENPGWYTP